jgi:hypothetical protein
MDNPEKMAADIWSLQFALLSGDGVLTYGIRYQGFFTPLLHFNSTVSSTYNHCAGTVDYRTTGKLGY